MADELLIGVENATSERTAHVVVIHGPEPQMGMSLCGWPSEELALIPGLDWSLVPAERRCPHCAEGAEALGDLIQ